MKKQQNEVLTKIKNNQTGAIVQDIWRYHSCRLMTANANRIYVVLTLISRYSRLIATQNYW